MDTEILANVPAEKTAPHANGFFMLPVVLVGLCASAACLVLGIIRLVNAFYAIGGILLAVGIVGLLFFPIMLAGFKVLAPNQAYVFTLFGKY